MFLARLHVGVVTDLAGIPFPFFVGVVTDLAGIPLTTGTRVKVVGWRDIFWQPSVYQKKNMLFACIHNVVLHWSCTVSYTHLTLPTICSV